MRRNGSRLLVLVMALALVASACGGGGGAAGDITRIREMNASDVRPPEPTDAGSLALPGLTLHTNSSTWNQLVNSPEGPGAVVLFVQPGGAADGKNIARGDVLVEVEGTAVSNHEHALTLLRSHENEERRARFIRRDGTENEVAIVGELPRERPRPYLDRMIQGNPSDPVLRYLRAQAVGGTIESAMDDLRVALEREPDFVEALALRGNTLWNQRQTNEDAQQRASLGSEALANWRQALDIDPRHIETLSLRSGAFTSIGRVQEGRDDAIRALEIDPTLASANAALARAELAENRPEAAAGPARAALELNPYTNLTYYRLLARVFRELDRPEECAATLNAAVPYLEGTGVDVLATEAQQLQREAQENCG